jgi:hypothetical protein
MKPQINTENTVLMGCEFSRIEKDILATEAQRCVCLTLHNFHVLCGENISVSSVVQKHWCNFVFSAG